MSNVVIFWLVFVGVALGALLSVLADERRLERRRQRQAEDWDALRRCPDCGDTFKVVHRGACPRCTAKHRARVDGIPPE